MKNAVKIAILALLTLVIIFLGLMLWAKRPAVALQGRWTEQGSKVYLEFYKDDTMVQGGNSKDIIKRYKFLNSETIEIDSTVNKFQIQENTLIFTDGEWTYRKFNKNVDNSLDDLLREL